ncbi:hypothetical protein [Bacillus sp. ISTL8]|uniref:hypothetical protein n=1 Tax=Bacillus sp. ISTL8 TaxID=2596896 RepID=UPI001456956A|nr:hypothetical protein [Bacillus sp. ISTL8]
MLLELVNGGVLNIISDNESYGGCSTCDWGSQYINLYEVEMTTGTIEIKVENMYEYLLSEDYMMKLFLPNTEKIQAMNEEELFNWIKEVFDRDHNSEAEEVSVRFIKYESEEK